MKIKFFLLLICYWQLQSFGQQEALSIRLKTSKEDMQKQSGALLTGADSLSRTCYKNYSDLIDSIARICNATSKETPDANWLSQTAAQGWTFDQQDTKTMSRLINALVRLPDSMVFRLVAESPLIKHIPPHQTDCCAIPDSWEAEDSIYNRMNALFFAALSTNEEYRSFSNYQRGNGTDGALFHAIETGLVDHDLLDVTRNGYRKLTQQEKDSIQSNASAIKPETSKKNNSMIYWAIGLAVILGVAGIYFWKTRRQG